MQIVDNRDDLRRWLGAQAASQRQVAFVPTMGNLHAGHLRLVEQARRNCDVVVVSIFVNPMQFGQNEDLDSYPWTPEADEAALRELQADLLYRPPVTDIYPGGLAQQTRVVVPLLSDILCGASRPGHFTGVATIVNRLFNLVQPDVSYFGKKDYQQYLVIRKMVADLAIPVEVVGVDTVREDSGLAMSSRNNYLSADELQQASGLYRVLGTVAEACRRQPAERQAIEQEARQQLAELGFRPDYVSVRRRVDLAEPLAEDRELIVLGAAWLGKPRLIDNLEFDI